MLLTKADVGFNLNLNKGTQVKLSTIQLISLIIWSIHIQSGDDFQLKLADHICVHKGTSGLQFVIGGKIKEELSFDNLPLLIAEAKKLLPGKDIPTDKNVPLRSLRSVRRCGDKVGFLDQNNSPLISILLIRKELEKTFVPFLILNM